MQGKFQVMNDRCKLEIGIMFFKTAFIEIGQSPVLKFIQLYTSESYNDFHSLLVQPEEHHSSDEEKHRFSPIICRFRAIIFQLILPLLIFFRYNFAGEFVTEGKLCGLIPAFLKV